MSTNATTPPETTPAAEKSKGEKASEFAGHARDKAGEFAESAREKASDAYDATVDTVKKKPVTSAAIATGAVAAVAGAVFGATKLLNKDDTKKTGGKKTTSKK